MDPLTHGVTGGALAAAAARPEERRRAVLIGAAAGMAPDIDIFFRSASDPLLHLEFHRGFTHGLGFAPVGAALVALMFFPLLRSGLAFGRIYLFALLGWLHHGLLDAATSYGTQLWWPFSDTRAAWSWVSVVDPLYTVPALGLLVVAAAAPMRLPRAAHLAVAWMLAYLALGAFQQHRAAVAGHELAARRGHTPEVVEAKPSIFNNLLFRTLYEYDGEYYVDAVRVGYFRQAVIFEGSAVPVFDATEAFPGLPPDSVLAHDIERFRHFSMGYLYQPPDTPEIVADLRYSMIPDSIEPLWGIRVDPARADEHAPFEHYRDAGPETRERFFARLFGPGSRGD
ncbi:MAG: metal-dependent hydrolase [Opitutales bacterium]|nr:metal-dependent hydrolase [Opitutales bacterium]